MPLPSFRAPAAAGSARSPRRPRAALLLHGLLLGGAGALEPESRGVRNAAPLTVRSVPAIAAQVVADAGASAGDRAPTVAPPGVEAAAPTRDVARAAALTRDSQAVAHRSPVRSAPREASPSPPAADSSLPSSAAATVITEAASADAFGADGVLAPSTRLVAAASTEPTPERRHDDRDDAADVHEGFDQSPTRVAAAAARERSGAPDADDEPVPTYATRFAPSMTLRYGVRRGFLQGTGEVHWEHTGATYALRLAASVAGLTLIEQTSRGRIDAAGIAPERFTDRRIKRSLQAANFQRDAGVVTFSGKPDAVPLRPGTQDRLSWMLQLPAILDARPELSTPGRTVSIPVVGARSDAGVWVFRSVGPETVETGDGAKVRATKLVREPRDPYDTAVEVWVDPARHHLPVQAKQRSGKDQFDLLLESLTPG
ncbi:DUF3108 domain-containing protein [Piscinibacter koreensis]|uniref:DUF3108 domain-containing protein n=1 Tax=Piscinibacter koreensis TaxID=2742824 RepID=A0A7Y6TUS9_9BURK|nr:DUF3108 domain-containing protein [Schlegelella koreensis]NUZ04191.1 DUF3108 domain-containing protein [Schlegelella koreensis]